MECEVVLISEPRVGLSQDLSASGRHLGGGCSFPFSTANSANESITDEGLFCVWDVKHVKEGISDSINERQEDVVFGPRAMVARAKSSVWATLRVAMIIWRRNRRSADGPGAEKWDTLSFPIVRDLAPVIHDRLLVVDSRVSDVTPGSRVRHL